MENLLRIQQKIVPETLSLLERRYYILRTIYYNQPIGRRNLAYKLNMGERTVRTEVNILKEQGLLIIDAIGMSITEDGKDIINNLSGVIYQLKGITELEEKLVKLLNVEEIIIIPGNSDDNNLILEDMGKTAAMYLKKLIVDNSIVGITGGSTMATVADEMPRGKIGHNIRVTPARGGLGRDVETQSNSIAAKLAKNIGADYNLLHMPDNIDKKTLDMMVSMEDIKEVLRLIESMDILIFGLGRADVMAERRQLAGKNIDKLLEEGAVAEAFGHYFNIKGEEIWESPTIGLSLDSFQDIPRVIGVAGGEGKAEAIISISSLRKNMTIITDEAAARKIIKICS